MSITKIIGVITQLCIIILALLLFYQFSSKQASDNRIDSIERSLNQKIDDDRKYLNDKITVQQDNVNRYIQLREDRAKLYSKRLDDLYDLYQKDPTPIDEANPRKQPEQITTPSRAEEKNTSYIEQRLNKAEDRIDVNNNKLSNRIDILEQRVLNIQGVRSSGVKVINTNLNTNTNVVNK